MWQRNVAGLIGDDSISGKAQVEDIVRTLVRQTKYTVVCAELTGDFNEATARNILAQVRAGASNVDFLLASVPTVGEHEINAWLGTLVAAFIAMTPVHVRVDASECGCSL